MSDQDKAPFGFSFNIDTRNLKSDATRNGRSGEDVFSVALLGDFSGRASRGLVDADRIGERRFIEIDRYNLDEVIAALDVRLSLEFDEDTLEITFRAFDDFHPDKLYNRVDAFGRLRELRARLQDNATFAQAVQEIQDWLLPEAEAPEPENDQFDEINEASIPVMQVAPTAVDEPGNLLDSILDETARQDAQPAQPSRKPTPTLVDDFIKQMVSKRGGDTVAAPRKQDMIAVVDAVISGLMRDILHHPKFQALEAGWQALRFLVNGCVPARTSSCICLIYAGVSWRSICRTMTLRKHGCASCSAMHPGAISTGA